MPMHVTDMDRRLQSLKLPRDLTLGGTKPKKVFLPNINATRNKDKKEFFIIKTEGQKKTNHRTNLRNNKKGFDRSEKFIQSSGIFSDGVGTDALKKVRYERAYVAKDDTTTSVSVSLPKIKTSWQMDIKNEANIYEDVTDDNSASADEKEKIAFRPSTWNESDLKEKNVPTNTYINKYIKSEPMPQTPHLNDLKTELNKMPQEYYEVDNLKPGLSLWKLPYSFCGKGFSDDPNVKTLSDYKLTHFQEGQIGKMRIHKSGKIYVQIGSIKYKIEAAQFPSYAEKIVALDIKKENASSILLGHVHNRCILNPDWASLLKDL